MSDNCVKSFDDDETGRRKYSTERDCYARLNDNSVSAVDSLTVPQFVGCNNKLLTIEMSVVEPPFCLDFAKACLDSLPPWADMAHLVTEFWAKSLDQMDCTANEFFTVRSAHDALRKLGIWHADINPGNFRLS